MDYRDRVFRDERVEMHGNFYHGCTFENCELIYDGDRSPTFRDNRYIDSVFVFTGAATRTLYFLANIYHAGEGGRQVIEDTFDAIRDHKLHGSEIRTIVPNTVDHSLD